MTELTRNAVNLRNQKLGNSNAKNVKPPILNRMNTLSYPQNYFPESPHAAIKRVKSIPGGIYTPKKKNMFDHNAEDLENDA